MTIQQFIEKAIEGGWRSDHKEMSLNPKTIRPETVLIDHEAWKAVGKVEGWHRGSIEETFHPTWKQNMRRMMDALAEGKTIEQFLETL